MKYIRKAVVQDVSRIAEILVFTKRMSYRSIFNNDKVSFGEMQVLPLAQSYIQNVRGLENIWVYDDEFVKGLIHIEKGEIKELYVDCFFKNMGIGTALLEFAVEEHNANCLWVLEKNYSAINFYQKNGFAKTNEHILEVGTPEYIVKMELARKDNPWEAIDLDTYEKHMSLNNVYQLQTMNEMMKGQFYTYPVKSVIILGIAGGNGLEHIDRQVFDKVYGVDINKDYLKSCSQRYPQLNGILETVCADLTKSTEKLSYADLLVANLLIEYIGYECFQKAVKQIKPKYVSCIIQINTDEGYVSDSPYIHVFDRLDEVHHQIEENELISTMRQIGFQKIIQVENELPNRKKLVRIDFGKEN